MCFWWESESVMRRVCISVSQTKVKLQPRPNLCGNEVEAGLNTPHSRMIPSLSVFLSLTLLHVNFLLPGADLRARGGKVQSVE